MQKPNEVREPEILNREEEPFDPESPPAGALVPVSGALQASGPSRALPALATMTDEQFEALAHAGRKLRERIQVVHRDIMQQDVDYGTIPGTPRPTLLKSGAEVLTKFLNGTARFLEPQFIERYVHRDDGQGGSWFLSYTVCCQIVDETGAVVGEGWGNCNSWEPKYRWREGQPTCPECGARTVFTSKFKDEPGFYCWAKKGGCGAKFAPSDERITSQPAGKVENPDPHGVLNTLLKMAQKRAHVAAALNGACASGSFTQDLEEDAPPTPQGGGASAPEEDELEAANRAAAQAAAGDRGGAAAPARKTPPTPPARPARPAAGPKDPAFERGVAKAKAKTEPAAPAPPAKAAADDDFVDDGGVAPSPEDLQARLKEAGCKSWADVRQYLGQLFPQEAFVQANGTTDLRMLSEAQRRRAGRWLDESIAQRKAEK